MDYITNALQSGIRQNSELKFWSKLGQPVSPSWHNLGKHYAHWANAARKLGVLETEFLVPRLITPFDARLPSAMQGADQAYLERPALRPKAGREQWGYYFYLGGGVSTWGGGKKRWACRADWRGIWHCIA